MHSIRCDSRIKWQIKKKSNRISKIVPFICKYNWKGINYPLGKDDWKNLEKNNPATALNILYAKKKKYTTHTLKNKFFFNGFKQTRMALSCGKKLSALLREIRQNVLVIFIFWIVFICLKKTNLNHIKRYVVLQYLVNKICH